MIVFRNCDPRYPFLWENESQPAARWHGSGDGPVQYFSDTPNGAWAEFVRHEEITDLADLAGVRRAIWAVEIDPSGCAHPALPMSVLTGDETTYEDCQQEAKNLKSGAAVGLVAPSAALKPGRAQGVRVDNGLKDGDPRDGIVYVLFGARPDLVGWRVTTDSQPPIQILDQVAYF